MVALGSARLDADLSVIAVGLDLHEGRSGDEQR
jgi:hypothetical protein